MEVTEEILKTLYKRLEQVYFAKTKNKPDTISLQEDGSFLCEHSYSISYGGTEVVSEYITSDELTADLDELVKIREAKEEEERIQDEKRRKERQEKFEREQRELRHSQYLKLEKEFGKK